MRDEQHLRLRRQQTRRNMKIGQRDVWIGVGKGESTPRRCWVVFTPLGREWIPADCAGRDEAFWLATSRRFEIHCPPWSFMLALTPQSRWVRIRDGHDEVRWIELERRRS